MLIEKVPDKYCPVVEYVTGGLSLSDREENVFLRLLHQAHQIAERIQVTLSPQEVIMLLSTAMYLAANTKPNSNGIGNFFDVPKKSQTTHEDALSEIAAPDA